MPKIEGFELMVCTMKVDLDVYNFIRTVDIAIVSNRFYSNLILLKSYYYGSSRHIYIGSIFSWKKLCCPRLISAEIVGGMVFCQ